MSDSVFKVCEQYSAGSVWLPHEQVVLPQTHGSFSAKQVTIAPVVFGLMNEKPTITPNRNAKNNILRFTLSPKRVLFPFLAGHNGLFR